LTVACYGVNSARQLQKAIAYDADAIITDYPGEMRKQLGG
jgi:glycerophosphoryl diester phosphodiesterase